MKLEKNLKNRVRTLVLFLFATFILSSCTEEMHYDMRSVANETKNTNRYMEDVKGIQLLAGKSNIRKGIAQPLGKKSVYVEKGYASWYAGHLHGKKTASGADYDENEYTAAHRALPIPSVVRVINLENNKEVVVVVTDRGPFEKRKRKLVKKRIIDLSRKAAEEVGMLEKGLVKVSIEYLPEETKEFISRLTSK